MVSIASLLGARHLWEVVENKRASSLVVSLGKALNGMPPPLCGRQVAHKPRKRQLPSECGLPVQSIAINSLSREGRIKMANKTSFFTPLPFAEKQGG